MRQLFHLIVFAAVLSVLGCPPPEKKTEAPAAAAPSSAPVDAGAAAAVAAGVGVTGSIDGTYEVTCGCVLPEVGHCAEYVKVGDAHVAMSGDLGLGKMPFCGKRGLVAEVAGEMSDGKLLVSSFQLK